MSAQGKGESSSRPAAIRAASSRDGLGPRGGDGDGQFGDFALGGVEPDFFAAPLLQQAIAVAQGFFKRRDPGSVIAVHRQHQSVEKAPPFARRAGEQPVHRGGEPDHAEMIGEDARRGRRLAVEPVFALRCAVAELQPGSQLQRRRRPRPRFRARPQSRHAPPSRAISASSARRRPRPGVNSDKASSRLVFPAPLSPARATIFEETRRSSAG